MQSVNDVRIVGVLTKDAVFKKTSQGNEFVLLQVRTTRYYTVGGHDKKVSYTHDVMCIQTHSIEALRSFGKAGTVVRVFGELGYDEHGRARIQVLQYMGEVGLMVPASAARAPESRKNEDFRPNASGGLGRTSRSRTTEEPGLESDPHQTGHPGGDPLGRPDPLDDQIPY
ncbi:single-stranded DNA-binding protein [Roseibium sp. RKSG952]|uniref:single-stranded DNA-binding protein n=1 Tax=Roseibium sp. RKSG952 TaxID=2529384 RepID=UPI0018AD216F|nr:single-stranded DNA-binding protein [Roseibium sp. RKSG952]